MILWRKLHLIGIVALGVTFLIGLGCSSRQVEKHFDEGVIEYAITYDDSQPFKYDTNLRPDRMIVKFKDNNTINKIEGLAGGFSFVIIQNYQQNIIHSLINFLGKNLCFTEPADTSKLPYAFAKMPEVSFTFSDEVVEYLGFNCKKAIGTYNDSLGQSFEILYTDELLINQPNRNTPFESIDGIMLKFSMMLMNQTIWLEAKTIKPMSVSDDEFILPTNYEQIDESTLNDVFELIN